MIIKRLRCTATTSINLFCESRPAALGRFVVVLFGKLAKRVLRTPPRLLRVREAEEAESRVRRLQICGLAWPLASLLSDYDYCVLSDKARGNMRASNLLIASTPLVEFRVSRISSLLSSEDCHLVTGALAYKSSRQSVRSCKERENRPYLSSVQSLAMYALSLCSSAILSAALVQALAPLHAVDGLAKPSSYIVKLFEGSSQSLHLASLVDTQPRSSVEVTHTFGQVIFNGYAANLHGSAIEHVRSLPDVEYVVPNTYVTAQTIVTQTDATWALGEISSATGLGSSPNTGALNYTYAYDSTGGAGGVSLEWV